MRLAGRRPGLEESIPQRRYDDEGQRARWSSIMDVVEEDSYREFMTQINHYAISAH